MKRLGLLVSAALLSGCMGFVADEPAWAEVNGQRYAVGPVPGLRASEERLQPYGTVGRTNSDGFFLNLEALTLDDVDPLAFLLVRSTPALQNDPDSPWGPYVGLWGDDHDPDLCAYVDAGALSFCQ